MIDIIDIIKEKNKIYAISETSPFYPDGKGGQLGDRGKIGSADVLFVEYKNNKFYHLIDKEIKPGKYEAEIDLKRRRMIAQQHTAQHILSAAFEQIADLDTVGFRIAEEYTTIDLEIPNLPENIEKDVEILSNKIIQQCLDVNEIIITKDEIARFKFRKPLSDKIQGKIRLIKIGDFDINPCGGFHVKNTGEIGLVKIISKEKVKGNLTRLYFLAGFRAINDYDKRIKITKNISNLLTAKIEDTPLRVEETLNKMKEYKSKYEKLNEKYAELIAKDIFSKAESINNIKFIYLETEEDFVNYLPKFLPMNEVLYIVKKDNRLEISSGIVNCKELINNIKNDYSEIKGGGGVNRGSLIGNIKIEDIKKYL
ncbi:alanyl-tRNA synthetase [Marinitoga hydrogenitolerans DSM 16785]|uniref:Alanyl-tRNA synthetase n=1 Tax=Marinitoga hydrogenitolerans (strain DSM 16785 / JCM 12826 / AT1271) TaxID=1122195 RepID=A0A1M4UDK1_MARH1|nr:alanyl-tRNA editing protein [Marinitoga hydrogenitolerans]SHE54677.1 alanyl-tRNA synthetase [Marinitoga hydrogenitolerans DSM 16785]